MTDLDSRRIELELLKAMRSLHQPKHGIKSVKVLRMAMSAMGKLDDSCEEALCNEGIEDPVTKTFYFALRELIRDGLAQGQGNFDAPAGPRYTECRITPLGLQRLNDLERT
jgi:hypothetical protein